MKSLFSNLFVVALFVCLSIQYGSGLSCYECNDWLPSKSCKYMSSIMIKDCGKDSSCSANWSHDISSGKNVTYVRRTCANITMDGSNRVFFYSNGSTVLYCNTELCNSADGVTSTKVILFISALLSLLFYKIGY